jgi:hypothetical protein
MRHEDLRVASSMRSAASPRRAYGVDGAIDGALVDSPILSQPPRMSGCLAPLLVLLLCEQLVEEEAIFLRKLLDPIENLVDGGSAHKSSERYSTSQASCPLLASSLQSTQNHGAGAADAWGGEATLR